MDQFERCLGWIEPALRYGAQSDMTLEALKAEIACGRRQLWPGRNCAMVTHLLETPEGGCCHIWLGGGDITELCALAPGMTAWARAQGCTHATIKGRPGWTRALKRLGWRVVDNELRKDL